MKESVSIFVPEDIHVVDRNHNLGGILVGHNYEDSQFVIVGVIKFETLIQQTKKLEIDELRCKLLRKTQQKHSHIDALSTYCACELQVIGVLFYDQKELKANELDMIPQSMQSKGEAFIVL